MRKVIPEKNEFHFKNFINMAVIVVALGYFVDIFDLTLFAMVRTQSLASLGIPIELQVEKGILLLNSQMAGMLLGGIFWGILGDKSGRIKVLFGSILLYSLANLLNAFVQDVPTYAFLRFISGIGLAGELGVGITLISESLPKTHRGLGTTLVATIGVLGAVFGGLMVEYIPWRFSYIIGGSLGLALLFLRFKVRESSLFNRGKESGHSNIQWGKFSTLFNNFERFKKFVLCIFLGIPIWYVAGLLMAFSPELSRELGVDGIITSSRSIAVSYLGLALGDFACGIFSQKIKGRLKAVLTFSIATMCFITLLFTTTKNHSSSYYYFLCFLIGVGAGFWAVFVTIAAEQFGTNIRATVATSVPNFVRGAVIPMTLSFKYFKNDFGLVNSMVIVGVVVFALNILATLILPETFHKDLEYFEHYT